MESTSDGIGSANDGHPATADPTILQALLSDAQEFNRLYDTRNATFVSINLGAIALTASLSDFSDPVRLVPTLAVSLFGIHLTGLWRDVLVMSKHYQLGREIDLRDHVTSSPGLAATFQSIAWSQKSENPRPPVPAVSASMARMVRAIRWAWIATALASASLMAGHAIPYVDGKLWGDVDAACLDVQKDMLSPHPARPDGPAVFKALGCRPQWREARITATRRTIVDRDQAATAPGRTTRNPGASREHG